MSTKRYRRRATRPTDRVEESIKKPSLNLNNLSLDIQIQIQSLLDPRDILAIRKCSKNLHSTSHERTVWMRALRRVCVEYSCFLPTYPTDEMSLSDLELAATSYYRFSSRLWSELENDQALLPVAARVLSPTGRSPHTQGFRDSILVPGGRFLVTRSNGGTVKLWDLGYMPDMLINTHELALLDNPFLDNEFELLLQPTANGLGLILLLVTTSTTDMSFDIYEIYPLSPAPVFHRIAKLPYSAVNVDAYVLTPDVLAFHGDEHTVVWNYKDNAWITWKVADDVLDIVVHEQNIVFLQENELTVYQIPPLRPCIERMPAEQALPQTPTLRVVCPLEGVTYSSPSIWQAASSSSLPLQYSQLYCLDIIGGDDNGKTAIWRYAMQPIIGAQNGDDLPGIIPTPIDFIDPVEIVSDGPRFKFFQLAESERLLCWSDDGTLKVNLSTVPLHTGHRNGNGGTTVERSQKAGILWRWSDLQIEESSFCAYSFCPMSGRMCVSSWDGEIRVLDFVRPPH